MNFLVLKHHDFKGQFGSSRADRSLLYSMYVGTANAVIPAGPCDLHIDRPTNICLSLHFNNVMARIPQKYQER